MINLVEMKRYRNKVMDVVYIDDSWVNTGTTIEKVWKVKALQTPQKAFLAGLYSGLKPRAALNTRFAIVHTGKVNGVLPNAHLVFLSKRNTADAHDKMDGEVYEQYFKDQVPPNLRPSSVTVLDNASYRSRNIETIPTMSWRKGKMQDWISSH
jgi:hypothetical protein